VLVLQFFPLSLYLTLPMALPLHTPPRRSRSLPPSSPLSPLTPSQTFLSSDDTFPPFDSDDLQLLATASSPVKGSRTQRIAMRHAKGQRKRTEALAVKTANEEVARLDAERLEEEQTAQKVAEKHTFFDEILLGLCQRGYSFAELLCYVSDPAFKQGQARWEIFRDHLSLAGILDLWANKSSLTSRERVRSWAVNFVASLVKKEVRSVTNSGMLQAHHQMMNTSFVLSFSLSSLQARLQTEIPIITSILSSMAISSCQAKKLSPQRLAKKLTV
jgi:hypothetical protein